MAKLSAARRGYGAEHRKLRAQIDELVRSGGAVCWRCGQPIHPREDYDLGHDDTDRSKYKGPEHRRCNRATNSADRRDAAPRRAQWWREAG